MSGWGVVGFLALLGLGVLLGVLLFGINIRIKRRVDDGAGNERAERVVNKMLLALSLKRELLMYERPVGQAAEMDKFHAKMDGYDMAVGLVRAHARQARGGK